MDHARDLAAKSNLHVLVIAPPAEVFALGDAPRAAIPDPPIDELQEPAPQQQALPASTQNFHDLFKAQAIDLQLPCQVVRPDTYGSPPLAPAVKGGYRIRPPLPGTSTPRFTTKRAGYLGDLRGKPRR
jgi:hypothetical protein